MPITAADTAPLNKGMLPILDQITTSTEQLRALLQHSHFESLAQLSVFFGKTSGAIQQCLERMHSADSIAKTIQRLNTILTTKSPYAMQRYAKAQEPELSISELDAMTALHTILHNRYSEDSHGQDFKISLLLNSYPDSPYNHIINPAPIRLQSKLQKTLGDWMQRYCDLLKKQNVIAICQRLATGFHRYRRRIADSELKLVNNIVDHLLSIMNSAHAFDVRCGTVLYRLRAAIDDLSSNPASYGLNPRVGAVLKDCLQASFDELRATLTLEVPELSERTCLAVLCSLPEHTPIPGDAITGRRQAAFAKRNAKITDTQRAIEAYLDTLQERSGFDTSLSRARYLALNNETISQDLMLQSALLVDADDKPIVSARPGHALTLAQLNAHFSMTPNGATYLTQSLQRIADTADATNQIPHDPFTREVLEFTPLDESRIDIAEINRLMHLQHLQHNNLLSKLSNHLLNAEHLKLLASLPSVCFTQTNIRLLNTIPADQLNTDTIATVTHLINIAGIKTTKRILLECNRSDIDCRLLNTLTASHLKDLDRTTQPLDAIRERLSREMAHIQQQMRSISDNLSFCLSFLYMDRATARTELRRLRQTLQQLKQLQQRIPDHAKPSERELAPSVVLA